MIYIFKSFMNIKKKKKQSWLYRDPSFSEYTLYPKHVLFPTNYSMHYWCPASPWVSLHTDLSQCIVGFREYAEYSHERAINLKGNYFLATSTTPSRRFSRHLPWNLLGSLQNETRRSARTIPRTCAIRRSFSSALTTLLPACDLFPLAHKLRAFILSLTIRELSWSSRVTKKNLSQRKIKQGRK